MRPVLVLRPEPGAHATAVAATALGLTAIVAPLFTVRALAWTPPAAPPDALLLTSAHAARLGGDALDAMLDTTVYAVGAATAAAARVRGFTRISTGEGDGAAIVARAAADGVGRLLHLAGREHVAPDPGPLEVERRLVYAAEAETALPQAARDALPDAVVLLHSPRAARTFASLVPDRAGLRGVAISAGTADAAGAGWQALAVAAGPSDAALLAAAAKLCDR